jgi:DNA ligase-1
MSGTTFVILEKKSAQGRNQIWKATVTDERVTYEYGVKDGKMQTKTDTYTVGKQKRSAKEQAKFEAVSTARKKIRLGYTLMNNKNFDELVGDTSETGGTKESKDQSPKPMLAKEFETKRVASEITVFMQPKLDGIRCVANPQSGELWTRGRKRLYGLDHIEKEILRVADTVTKKVWLDGEIYCHGMSFQEITSLAKKQKNLSGQSAKLEYHIYDLVSTNTPFVKRLACLENLKAAIDLGGPLKIVDTIEVAVAEIQNGHKTYLDKGYEGSIIRIRNATYETDKRSSSLLKLKDFKQEEYLVIGFNEEKTETGSTLGSCIVQDFADKSKTFSATPSLPDSMKKQIWENQKEFFGKKASIKFFELTRDGIPRFPVLLGFRDFD